MKKILFLSLVTAACAVAGSSQLFSRTQEEVDKALKDVKALMAEEGLQDEGNRAKIIDLGEILIESKKDIKEKIDEHTTLKIKAGSNEMKIKTPCIGKFTMNYDGTDEINQEIVSFFKK